MTSHLLSDQTIAEFARHVALIAVEANDENGYDK